MFCFIVIYVMSKKELVKSLKEPSKVGKTNKINNLPPDCVYDARELMLDEMSRISGNTKGEVLTLIDASISDAEQRKALKDLVHQIFSRSQKNMLWPTADFIFDKLSVGLGYKKLFPQELIDAIPDHEYHCEQPISAMN